MSNCEPFVQGRKSDHHVGGGWGSFVCFGVSDVEILEALWSHTCLSALCIETVSKIHSCTARAALKMI